MGTSHFISRCHYLMTSYDDNVADRAPHDQGDFYRPAQKPRSQNLTSGQRMRWADPTRRSATSSDRGKLRVDHADGQVSYRSDRHGARAQSQGVSRQTAEPHDGASLRYRRDVYGLNGDESVEPSAG
jgi:hypothetical protein